MIRLSVAGVVAAVLILAGCSAAPAAETAPSAAPTEEATTDEAGTTLPPVESLADIAETRWIGVDSDGDTVTVKFLEGGQVHYTSYGEQFEYPADTWAVTDDTTIVWNLTFGARYGVVTYTGTFDADAQTISATTSSTVGATGTAEFKQPAR